MKIKIDEVGFESFTGQLGMIDFENGVSVNDVSVGDINHMSAVMRVVSADTGAQQGALMEWEKDIDRAFPTSAETTITPETETLPVDTQSEQTPQTPDHEYTQEELEALADKEGINGLREVAEPLGVKGTSISGLISSILAKIKG